ncbi:hypothetical protein Bealeia1_01624 [Candidatus Bealeia paramacronuclearis]|uniref:Secreted protein n=1 Tax=Candidatus Bealeia paramacronuclearis TaxID=1921001 RepID=A0ABZ2C4P2_9PROT|nr:hypothetical protein [Candidatus Bealeia paramacronuclearis]
MKFKILSLFLTVSLLCFGSGVKAQTDANANASNQEAPAACPGGAVLKTAFSTILCKAATLPILGNADCSTFCSNIGAGKTTPGKTVEACMAYIKGIPNVGSVLTSFISQGCDKACSANFVCKSCSEDATRKVCGYLCCPIDQSTVKNCMSKNNDDCKNYIESGSKGEI